MTEPLDAKALQRKVEADMAAKASAPPPTPIRPLSNAPRGRAITVPTSEDIDPAHLAEPIANIVREAKRAYGGHYAIAASAALGAFVACVQGKAVVRIDQRYRSELSLIWLVFSPAAGGKSSHVKLVTGYIERYLAELDQQLKPKIAFIRAKRAGLEKEIAHLGRAAALENDNNASWREPAPDSPTLKLRHMAKRLAELKIPTVPRLIRTDINPQKMPARMMRNAEADGIARLSIISPEPATLENLMGRHSRGEPILETVLAGYDGDPIHEDRRGEHAGHLVEVDIERAHLSMSVLGQPDVLDKMLSFDAFARRGFWSRCMLHTLGYTTSPGDDEPPVSGDVIASYEALLKAALEWQPQNLKARPEVDLSDLNEGIRELRRDAELRAARNPDETARGRRALDRACRIVALNRLAHALMRRADECIDASMQGLGGGMGVATLPGAGLEDLKYWYYHSYPNSIAGIRNVYSLTDPASGGTLSQTLHTLALMHRCIDRFGPGKEWAPNALMQRLPASMRKMSVLQPILDELEQGEYIERVAGAERTYQGRRVVTRYTTLTLEQESAAQLRVVADPEDDGR